MSGDTSGVGSGGKSVKRCNELCVGLVYSEPH
jgi:hypothetical protein